MVATTTMWSLVPDLTRIFPTRFSMRTTRAPAGISILRTRVVSAAARGAVTRRAMADARARRRGRAWRTEPPFESGQKCESGQTCESLKIGTDREFGVDRANPATPLYAPG